MKTASKAQALAAIDDIAAKHCAAEPVREPWSMFGLLAWRHATNKRAQRSAEALAAELSVERTPVVPKQMRDALTAFRHLAQHQRVAKARAWRKREGLEP